MSTAKYKDKRQMVSNTIKTSEPSLLKTYHTLLKKKIKNATLSSNAFLLLVSYDALSDIMSNRKEKTTSQPYKTSFIM